MIVRMWMTKDVVNAGPDTTVLQAATLMTKHRIRRLPVVNAHQKGPHLLGIVSASDLIRACAPEINPFAAVVPENERTFARISDIMKSEPLTTHPDAAIEEAASLMRDHKVGALPVVHEGNVVGLITESDIFGAFVSLFATSEPCVRLTFDMSEGEDVFKLISEAARKRRLHVASLISAHQDDRPVCVVRLTGSGVDGLMDELWSSGHRVLNVVRLSGTQKRQINA